MMKSIHVSLLPYLSFKATLSITISMYFIYSKEIHIQIIDLKVNQFRGNNPEHNITNCLFTPNLRCWKKGTISLGLPTTL